MERLTYRNSIGGAEWMPYPSMSDVRDKLCAYEDAEENGTLVRAKGFCCDCRELILHENANVYAECPKVGTKFKPFELDTRKHFCEYFTEKALKEREIDNG